MFAALANLSCALGLFFMGARFLTEQLKTLTSRRLRLSALRWTRNRWMGFAWGLVAGSIMQSMTVLTLLVISMLKSDLASSRRMFPILIGGSVGVTLLVPIVMLDVKLIAMYALGITGLLTLIMKSMLASRYRAMASACFGLGMIVLGLIMFRESVVPLATHPWFQQLIEMTGDSLLLPLLSGMVLTFVMQSRAPASLAGISMAAAGFIGIHQVIMIFCGACLGSSLILYLLTMSITGRVRQVAMYQVFHNVLVNAIVVPLTCIEAYLEVPLLAAAMRAGGLSLEQNLAIYLVFLECFTAMFRLASLGVVVRWLERGWPSTEIETLAKPRFIHDQALDDAEAALRLADLEQRRLLEMLSRYLDAVRRGIEPSELRESAKELLNRIQEFLDDLAAHCPDHEMDAHHSLLTRQKLFIWLEQQVIDLCDVLHRLPPGSPLATWSLSLVEGIDVVLLVLIDTLASDDAAAWPSTTQLMGDRSELLRRLRDVSLKEEPPLTSDERVKVLKLANIAEHLFLLLSQLAHEYRLASGVDEAFLDHAGLEDPASVPMARPNAPQAVLSLRRFHTSPARHPARAGSR